LSLIEAAFGVRPLPKPLGLYSVAAIGETIESKDAVEARTLIDRADAMGGVLFTFAGFRFLLLLAEGDVPAVTEMPSTRGWIESGVVYHIRDLDNRVGKKLSHRVRFKWP